MVAPILWLEITLNHDQQLKLKLADATARFYGLSANKIRFCFYGHVPLTSELVIKFLYLQLYIIIINLC